VAVITFGTVCFAHATFTVFGAAINALGNRGTSAAEVTNASRALSQTGVAEEISVVVGAAFTEVAFLVVGIQIGVTEETMELWFFFLCFTLSNSFLGRG